MVVCKLWEDFFAVGSLRQRKATASLDNDTDKYLTAETKCKSKKTQRLYPFLTESPTPVYNYRTWSAWPVQVCSFTALLHGDGEELAFHGSR